MTRKKDVNEPGNGGQFAGRIRSDSDVALTPERPLKFVSGETATMFLRSVVRVFGHGTGQVTDVVDGGRFKVTLVDGSTITANRDELQVQVCGIDYRFDQTRRLTEIRMIAQRMRTLKTASRDDIAAISDALDAGNRHTGMHALILACESDGCDRWLSDNADEIFDEGYKAHRDDTEPGSYFTALSAAHTAARALSARHLIGKAPGWTQRAYDQVTRPWRTVQGSIHPDDVLYPASWAKRPLDDALLNRLSPDVRADALTSARICAFVAQDPKRRSRS